MTLRLNGSTSGYTEIDAPAVAGSNTLVLPGGNGSADQALVTNGSGTLSWSDRGRMTLATAQNSTSGTAIDFTGIPSWAKRVTVIFNETSINGSSNFLIQLGAGSVTTSGYVSTGNGYNSSSATGGASSTSGFLVFFSGAANVVSGHALFTLFGSNSWISSHSVKIDANTVSTGGGSVILSGSLDRVRITTVSGSPSFDAGSINILYEG